MQTIIIGASAAGIAAVKALRKAVPGCGITVISLDDRIYSRVKLHQFLSGETDAAGIGFVAADFFEQQNVCWRGGERVAAVDGKSKFITLESGERCVYDRLLIASGADAVIPPIPHFRDANNVCGLRTLADARRIAGMAQQGKRCVIVGSGLVGLDAASALTARGVQVDLVEMADRVSPLQLDCRAAKAYQDLFEARGCRFHLKAKAVGSEIGSDGAITAVQLEDKTLPCDFVVVAAGVRPAVAFLEGSGIPLENGVQVDRFLQTGIDGVFAAGDVAGVAGSWAAASKQGEIAGKNMGGAQEEYVPEVSRNFLNYYGLATVSLGGAVPQVGEVLVEEDGRNYCRVTRVNGAPVHVILQGDVSRAAFWQKQLKIG